MAQPLGTQYLESKVLTAPVHRLHLMLIEGAIRFGRQAEAALDRGEPLAASAPLLRMLDIMGELLAGVRESQTDLNKQIAEFYLYLFRIVSKAKVNDDAAKLGEALNLLEFERQTWQLVCNKMESSSAGTPQARPKITPVFGNITSPSALGISLEA